MTLPALNFNESALFTALRTFLVGLNLTTSGTGPIEIVQGQQSRVPEPVGPDYVIFWPIGRPRLATNQDVYGDCAFTGQVSGNTLSVSNIQFGVVQIGGQLYGSAVPLGTIVQSQLTGTAGGGSGTYALSASFSAGSSTMAAGAFFAMQEAEVDVQIDVHGPNSHDNAAVITTLFRDDYAVEQFLTFGSAPPGYPGVGIFGANPWQQNVGNYTAVAPIHADDPRQIPFLNAEQQYENRWIITARLQANQIVSVPLQFFSTVSVKQYDITSFF
jgi:hypothetical protein